MKNIIFDIGAVLVEWDAPLAFAGHFVTRDEAIAWMDRIGFYDWNYEQDGGRSFADGLRAAHDQHGDEAAPLADYLDTFGMTIAHPVPGSWELLETLTAANAPLYAITNWAAETWPTALQIYPRLATVFRDVVVSGQVGLLKPRPQIYRLLMDRNDLRPEDCIFIDDNKANVEGAQAVGIDGIHFTGADQLALDLAERGILPKTRH
ncbi:HAD family hydrolase [Paracoccus sulfuroxidans]|uniref:2-haloacid dehalogenase n=1 Tax=Paracoccus sulfuroxidans TaxID=384678 RepID=A0A562NNX7_9RHOB|nr:HAD family phosphatase [Paracoccus sulfuroxidans]TWI33436.1 2-haloacid dehalogenase [Paracoccus sulfuroxidans]